LIIDFRVENYRSIRTEVVLSAIEAPDSAGKGRQGTGKRRIKPDQEIAPARRIERLGIGILPVLGIFGPNASGKSNVVQALDDLLSIMRGHPNFADRLPSRFQPFKLDPDFADKPTTLSVRLLVGEVVYTYTISLNQSQIHLEELEYLPEDATESRLVYRRTRQTDTNEVAWVNGPEFAGQPHTLLQASIRPFHPFLSVLMNQVTVSATEPLAQWLAMHISGVTLGEEEFDRELLADYSAQQESICRLLESYLHAFDTGVHRVRVKTEKRGESERHELYVVHETPHGDVEWSLEEESVGTRNLVSMLPKLVLSTLPGEGAGTAIVDELGASVHTQLCHELIQMFQDPAKNPARGQLIFTSHDTTLQQGQLLRRDQVWFTQKRKDGSTDLYPLTDFKPRNDLVIHRAYLDGRFGAVPVIRELAAATPEPVS